MELLISNGSDRMMPRGQLGMRKIRFLPHCKNL